MNPVYGTNNELYCATITFGDRVYLFSHEDVSKILNCKQKFVFLDFANEDYPSFASNYKRVDYLNFIYSLSKESVCFAFRNGNQYDLRRCNVETYHKYHKTVCEQYCVLEYIPGHHMSIGPDAGIMKNPLWRILDDNGRQCLLMYCEKDTLCKLCDDSYQRIIDFENNFNEGTKLTWYQGFNGYIQSRMSSNQKHIYIHQVIMNCYGNGKGTKHISVDHIDQNKLNNMLGNLRIATRKEQEQNSKGIKDGTKRERKNGARDLPDGITQEMMKKYVVYYHEWLDKEHTKGREYFRVEKHPKLGKDWCTSKSNKVSIIDKLNHANKVVDDLANDIYPESEAAVLPKYISLVNSRGKPHLVFEKRVADGTRLNVKMVMPEEHDLDDQLSLFRTKIIEKYGAGVI